MFGKFIRALKIARSLYNNHGNSEFVVLIFKSLFKIDHILIYSRDLTKDIASSRNHTVGGYVKKGNQAAIESIRKNMHGPSWEFSCDIYDRVKDFFIYNQNGVIGHISWVYYKDDPNRILNLHDDEGEIKYSLTLPQFRGRGVYPTVLMAVQKYLKEQGYKRLFICTRQENLSSVRGIEKAGFSFVRKINLIKILGVQVSKRYATSR